MTITALDEYAHDGSTGGWNQETGNPTISTFANAVQVWTIAQEGQPTILDAAFAFNVSPDIIRQAINWHDWMLMGRGDVIEHDGEF